MKLRNKKTGEIVSLSLYGITLYIRSSEQPTYHSIEQLCEEWEDVGDTNDTDIPLIKDPKVRKAVRAWAEANGIGGCVCKEEIHCITFETERGMFISFEDSDPIPPEGNYTVTELCGDEEE